MSLFIGSPPLALRQPQAQEQKTRTLGSSSVALGDPVRDGYRSVMVMEECPAQNCTLRMSTPLCNAHVQNVVRHL